MNLAELVLALILQTKEVKNVNLGNHSNISIIQPGDSLVLREAREAADRERVERSNREVAAREKAQRAMRGGSVLEVIGEYRVWGGCVPYAWSQGMQTRGYGWAKNYPVTQTPQKFAITKESWTGHAVVIEQDLGDKVIVRDANYIPYKLTRRIIPKSLIKGYLI